MPIFGSMRSAWLLALNTTCTWLSMRPGMSVRPAPFNTVQPSGAAIASVLIRAILFFSTSTFIGPVTLPLFPSNTRTFWKRTGVSGAGSGTALAAAPGSCAADVAAEAGVCASAAAFGALAGVC